MDFSVSLACRWLNWLDPAAFGQAWTLNCPVQLLFGSPLQCAMAADFYQFQWDRIGYESHKMIWIVRWPPWNSSYSCHIAISGWDQHQQGFKTTVYASHTLWLSGAGQFLVEVLKASIDLGTAKKMTNSARIHIIPLNSTNVSTLFHLFSIYLPTFQKCASQIFENTLNTLHRLICSI